MDAAYVETKIKPFYEPIRQEEHGCLELIVTPIPEIPRMGPERLADCAAVPFPLAWKHLAITEHVELNRWHSQGYYGTTPRNDEEEYSYYKRMEKR